MRKLWILILMDLKGITRKISYYFIMSAVVGAIFYSISLYTSHATYNFETFQSSTYKWLLLMVALISAYYGIVRTAKVRKIGIIEELIAIPVKKHHLIMSIFFSRVLAVWLPVFLAYIISGLSTELISPGFLSIVGVGISLFVFIAFFVSIGYFVTVMFARALIPIVIIFALTMTFWHIATMFPYWGNSYLWIQQLVYKFSAGFNPFTFMYGLGLTNFMIAPFIFSIVFTVIMVIVAGSVFKNSGWVPGDVQAKFRIKILIVIRNLMIVLVSFFVLSGVLSWYVGFYSIDLSDDAKATPREAFIENIPEISVQFSDDNVDMLRYSIYFDKLTRKSNIPVVWTPTSMSEWTGAVFFNDNEESLYIEMGYLESSDQDRDSLALRLDRIINKDKTQKIECLPGINQLGDFENIAISFASRKESRRRVYAVGRNYTDSKDFQNLVKDETFEVIVPPSIDYIAQNIRHSKDVLLIAPKSYDEFNENSINMLFEMINGGVASFILLPEITVPDNITKLYERKLSDPLCTKLEDLGLEVSVGRYKYKDLDSFISDNSNVCCYANYNIYADRNALKSTTTKTLMPIEFYNLKSLNKDWESLLTCCEDVQFEDDVNSLVVLMAQNSKRNMIVAGIQRFKPTNYGKKFEILRNLIANSLNVCAGKKLNNLETYNYIRRVKNNYSDKKQSIIDMILIIAYIIWLAAIIITILRIFKNWRYLGAKL